MSQFFSSSAVCQSPSWEVADYFVVLTIMMIYDDGNDLHDLVCDDYDYDTICDFIMSMFMTTKVMIGMMMAVMVMAMPMVMVMPAKLRISSANSSGSSMAPKWPPLSIGIIASKLILRLFFFFTNIE